jgi:hypothetical protein
MFQITNFVVRSIVAASLLFGAQVFAAAAQLEPLTIGYSNFTGTYGPLWIAVEGTYRFKTNKAKILAVFKRYMKGADDEILEETYQSTRPTLDEAPYPSVQVVKSALEMLSLQYPQAKQTDASLIVEPSIMKKIDDSGFVRALYKK